MRPPLAVGDLHGRSDLLDQLLEAYPDRDLVFLGDYCDRGPDTPGVLRRVRQLVESGRATALRGNHDQVFISSLLDGFENHGWQFNYLGPTLRQYPNEAAALEDARWMREHLAEWHRVGDIYLSHAAPHLVPDPNADVSAHLWQRPGDPEPRGPLPKGCDLAVHGHTPTPHLNPGGEAIPVLIDYGPLGRAWYIDLGAFVTGRLGLFDLESRQTGVLVGTPQAQVQV